MPFFKHISLSEDDSDSSLNKNLGILSHCPHVIILSSLQMFLIFWISSFILFCFIMCLYNSTAQITQKKKGGKGGEGGEKQWNRDKLIVGFILLITVELQWGTKWQMNQNSNLDKFHGGILGLKCQCWLYSVQQDILFTVLQTVPKTCRSYVTSFPGPTTRCPRHTSHTSGKEELYE